MGGHAGFCPLGVNLLVARRVESPRHHPRKLFKLTLVDDLRHDLRELHAASLGIAGALHLLDNSTCKRPN